MPLAYPSLSCNPCPLHYLEHEQKFLNLSHSASRQHSPYLISSDFNEIWYTLHFPCQWGILKISSSYILPFHGNKRVCLGEGALRSAFSKLPKTTISEIILCLEVLVMVYFKGFPYIYSRIIILPLLDM